MAIELVTGWHGEDHITAAQEADLFRGSIGCTGRLNVGNLMTPTVLTVNQISIADGVCLIDGRECYIGYGETCNVEIESGTQNQYRNDLIVITYTKGDDGVESVAFEVIQGTPDAKSPVDPPYSDMDIRTGVFTSQKAFCRVRLNGVNIEGIDMLMDMLSSAGVITPPHQSGTLTYTGEVQSPEWNGYDESKMSMSGEMEGTDAGTYTVTVTPIGSYHWSGGGTDPVSVTWSIGKAKLTDFTLSTSSVEVTVSSNASVTVTHAGDGSVEAYSDDESIATVSCSGNTVTITYVDNGTTTVHIRVGEGTNYLSSEYKDVAVTAKGASSVLDNTSWTTISEIGESGTQETYWDVGDVKGVPISGTVGILALAATYYAYIIGFNHNESVEGTAPITFQLAKDESGNHVAFCDSNYNSTATTGFVMNTTSTNSGGWASSYMRGTVIPTLVSALPTELQSVIRTITKYTDNTGGGSDTASNVTTTEDNVFLLAEFEIQGARSYANSAEQNYQKQYQYYANGNSKIFYNHSDVSTAVYVWLRSPGYYGSYYFCLVSAGGAASYTNGANTSRGFAPAFAV